MQSFESPSEILSSYQQVEKYIFYYITKFPFIKIFYYIPVLFSIVLLLLGYYGFIIIICFQHLYSYGYEIFASYVIISFTIIWSLGVISFIRTMFSDPGRIPEEFILQANEIEEKYKLNTQNNEINNDSDSINVQCLPMHNNKATEALEKTMEAVNKGYIICRRCDIPRPPRSHHCRHCNKCTCRLDHHCPIVNNCIGFKNYKFFLLIIFYCFIGCLEAFFVGLLWLILPGLPSLSLGEFIFMLIGAFIGSAYTIGTGIFISFHLWLLFHNCTTLEILALGIKKIFQRNSGSLELIFNVGYKQNFIQIFGSNPFLWIIPVYTTCIDGCNYPLQYEHQSKMNTLSSGGSFYTSMMDSIEESTIQTRKRRVVEEI